MGVKYSDVIERMKHAANLKNDSRVAAALGVTPQAISNYKKRGTFPSDLILKFADTYGISVDWLITGQGNMHRHGRQQEWSKEIPRAGEDMTAYGEAAKHGLFDFTSLTPEELICVGKLLKVLREADKSTVSVLKWSVDAFLKATDASREEKKG